MQIVVRKIGIEEKLIELSLIELRCTGGDMRDHRSHLFARKGPVAIKDAEGRYARGIRHADTRTFYFGVLEHPSEVSCVFITWRRQTLDGVLKQRVETRVEPGNDRVPNHRFRILSATVVFDGF